MGELNTRRSRRAIFYASVAIAVIAGVGLATVYQFESGSNRPQTVVGDPSKRIGMGDGKSQNPIALPGLDHPSGQAGR